jgi:hypothetical protein
MLEKFKKKSRIVKFDENKMKKKIALTFDARDIKKDLFLCPLSLGISV